MVEREDAYNISETGNWNVAADYSKLKIMKNLYLADEYANVAIFGWDSLLDELDNIGIVPDALKLKGFERLVNCLILLIDNSLFAVKKEKDKLEKYRKELKGFLGVMSQLYKVVTDRKTKIQSVKINKDYTKVLDRVIEIKSLINEPLNKNHLIFTDKEEYDPVAHKAQIIKDMTTRG